jgi:hypothetical protein
MSITLSPCLSKVKETFGKILELDEVSSTLPPCTLARVIIFTNPSIEEFGSLGYTTKGPTLNSVLDFVKLIV